MIERLQDFLIKTATRKRQKEMKKTLSGERKMEMRTARHKDDNAKGRSQAKAPRTQKTATGKRKKTTLAGERKMEMRTAQHIDGKPEGERRLWSKSCLQFS